jgi:thymidylate synthase
MKYTHEDGTPFTKEEFLQKLKTDKEFNDEFGNKGIDQIENLIEQLKENPDSRRLLVSAWAVHDLPKMTLPPCHYGFQVYTRELSGVERLEYYAKHWFTINEVVPLDTTHEDMGENNVPTRAISLMWNQRSVDTFLGLPFNIASYGLLLEIIAKEVNMVPDELIGNLGDVHLYKNHIEQAKEQIGRELSMEEKEEWCRNNSNHMDCPMHTREPMKLPTLNIVNNLDIINIKDDKQDRFEKSEIWLENYESHPTIKAPLNN